MTSKFNKEDLSDVDKVIVAVLEQVVKDINDLKKAVNISLRFLGKKTFDVKDKNLWSPDGF